MFCNKNEKFIGMNNTCISGTLPLYCPYPITKGEIAMKRRFSVWLLSLLALLMALGLTACGGAEAQPEDAGQTAYTETEPAGSGDAADATDPADTQTDQGSGRAAPQENGTVLDEDGYYSSRDEVALYLHLYGHLPDNFITKKEAQDLGWSGGSLEPYAPGCSIGGSRFGNYEGLLPDRKGRTWTECDIDTMGAKSRGAKRIVFSNDGLIYYTGDHYESFELLYGEE